MFFAQGHTISELMPLQPSTCPGCGRNVIIDSKHGDFICGSGLCRYLYVIT